FPGAGLAFIANTTEPSRLLSRATCAVAGDISSTGPSAARVTVISAAAPVLLNSVTRPSNTSLGLMKREAFLDDDLIADDHLRGERSETVVLRRHGHDDQLAVEFREGERSRGFADGVGLEQPRPEGRRFDAASGDRVDMPLAGGGQIFVPGAEMALRLRHLGV